jgi:SAM-dependent methyltransferase
VAALIAPARTILDFGCGIGILTTFFARQCSDRRFVGIDRSSASIEYARRRAAELELVNVEFHTIDLDREPMPGPYDLVIATHALLQAEQDPGLPSDRWDTFARGQDAGRQIRFEERTGLVPRLDHLVSLVSEYGRMLVFEKTRLLARRVPFQRSLAARGLSLLEPPEPIHYALVEEAVEDGPFYALGRRAGSGGGDWSELPEEQDSIPLDLHAVKRRPRMGEDPLYESHTASAQRLWQSLPDRRVIREFTRQGPHGRQLHAELGTTQDLCYLYVANTFDQRQLALIEQARARVLDAYYEEIEKEG